MFLNFSTKSANFIILLLNNTIKSLAFLTQHFNFILAFKVQLFSYIFILGNSFLQFVVFSTDDFELILKFAHLAGRKSQVFLSLSVFFVERIVLAQKLLKSLLISLGFLCDGTNSSLVVIKL